jgi:hypothetical protein
MCFASGPNIARREHRTNGRLGEKSAERRVRRRRFFNVAAKAATHKATEGRASMTTRSVEQTNARRESRRKVCAARVGFYVGALRRRSSQRDDVAASHVPQGSENSKERRDVGATKTEGPAARRAQAKKPRPRKNCERKVKTRTLQKPKSAAPAKDNRSRRRCEGLGHPPDRMRPSV